MKSCLLIVKVNLHSENEFNISSSTPIPIDVVGLEVDEHRIGRNEVDGEPCSSES